MAVTSTPRITFLGGITYYLCAIRGKVFVFTGILPVCTDENGLAAVLGHEIAHVVAHHFAERMSNSFVALGIVLGLSAMFDISGHLPSIFLDLLYSLPNSRTQEV